MLQWLKLDVEVEGNYQPPFFIGSMLRGVIGNALKRVVCINPNDGENFIPLTGIVPLGSYIIKEER